MSPWHVACQKGSLEIVKSFLKIEDLQIDQQGNQVFLFSLVWDFFDDLLKINICETKRERQLCLRQLREVILTLLLYWWKKVLQSILEIESVFSLLIFFIWKNEKNIFFYFLNVLSFFVCWRWGRGIYEILFCHFVILVSNVSLSHCLSKREFRDCQNFSENKRSSDWSTRKKGFFFSSFLLFEISLMILKKKGKDSFVWGNSGRSFWHYYFIGGRRCFNQF